MNKFVVITNLLLLLWAFGALKFAECRTSATATGLKLEIAAARLPSPRSELAAVYDDHDSVYIIGGKAWQDEILKYSLSSDNLTIIGRGPMLYAGSLIMSTPSNANEESLIYIGGYEDGERTTNVYRFSSATGARIFDRDPRPRLPSESAYHALAGDRQNGLAYILGGDPCYESLSTVLRYNTSSHSIEMLPARLPEGRFGSAGVWANVHGAAYLFGGQLDEQPYDILRFDPTSPKKKVVTLSKKLPHPVSFGVAIYDELNSVVYIASEYGKLMRFNPNDESVEVLTADGWPSYLEYSAGVYVPKLGRMYLFGGWAKFQGDAKVSRTDIIMFMELGLGQRPRQRPAQPEEVPVEKEPGCSNSNSNDGSYTEGCGESWLHNLLALARGFINMLEL